MRLCIAWRLAIAASMPLACGEVKLAGSQLLLNHWLVQGYTYCRSALAVEVTVPTVRGLALSQFCTPISALPTLVWVDWPVRASTSHATLAASLARVRSQGAAVPPQHQIWRVSWDE
jgi:hypothetical protein